MNAHREPQSTGPRILRVLAGCAVPAVTLAGGADIASHGGPFGWPPDATAHTVAISIARPALVLALTTALAAVAIPAESRQDGPMTLELPRWLRRFTPTPQAASSAQAPAAPPPSMVDGAMPDDVTDEELTAAVVRATQLGYGRGGSRGCMVPEKLVTALVLDARARTAEPTPE